MKTREEIVHILLDNGESILNDKGVDEKVCGEIADEILGNKPPAIVAKPDSRRIEERSLLAVVYYLNFETTRECSDDGLVLKPFSFESDGSVMVIRFLGHAVWDSEDNRADDDRNVDTVKKHILCQLKDLLGVLHRMESMVLPKVLGVVAEHDGPR